MGTRAVYTTPLKALSNTKFNELKRRFEPEFQVGLLTGDRKIDTNANCVVATTEIYRNELYRGAERYSLVVLDEVHFIADTQRGAVWEESIILTPDSCTLLMLSASISNADEVAAWLEEVRGRPCRVITETKRSVELRLAFLHPDYGIIPLRDEQKGIHREVLEYYSASRRGGRRSGESSSRGRNSNGPRRSQSLEYRGQESPGDRSGQKSFRSKRRRR